MTPSSTLVADVHYTPLVSKRFAHGPNRSAEDETEPPLAHRVRIIIITSGTGPEATEPALRNDSKTAQGNRTRDDQHVNRTPKRACMIQRFRNVSSGLT